MPADYPGPIADHPDAARWMLNCIHFRRVTRHFDHDEYINLHSSLLALVMGKNTYVRPVRDALRAHGIIECDDLWSLGTKSLGYRIGPAIRGCRWHRYYASDKRFLKRVASFREYVTTPKDLTLQQHRHLARWVRRVKVDPSYEVVLGEMEDEQREFASLQVEKINQGMLHMSVCPYGRFHSNFTSLSRKVRPYLTVDDCPLVECDIVNSQPYFLAVILLEIALSKSSSNVSSLCDLVFDCMHDLSSRKGQENKGEGENGSNRLYVFPLSVIPESPQENKGEGENGSEGLYVPPLSSPSERQQQEKRQPQETEGLYVFPLSRFKKRSNSVLDLIQPDLRQFVETSIGGGFYETFDLGQCDRDVLKQKVFQVLYGSRHCMAHSELGPQFRRLYPTAYDMIDNIKKHMGYEWIGRELQRRESQIVVNGLVGDLLLDHPEIPIVTVHDSVMTTNEHMGTVKALLRQQLACNYYQPRLKDKPTSVPDPSRGHSHAQEGTHGPRPGPGGSGTP